MNGDNGGEQRPIKLKIVGDAGTGKTSLIHRYVSGEYSDNVKTTISADFSLKKVKIDGNEYEVQLWDLAGTYRSCKDVTEQFFRKTDGVMICCNAVQQNLYESVYEWRQMVSDFSSFGVPCVLAMTQVDRYIPEPNWSETFGMLDYSNGCLKVAPSNLKFDAFFQTSAKDDVGVTEAFRELLTLVIAYMAHRSTTFTYNRDSSTRESDQYPVHREMADSIDIAITRRNRKTWHRGCCVAL